MNLRMPTGDLRAEGFVKTHFAEPTNCDRPAEMFRNRLGTSNVSQCDSVAQGYISPSC